MSVSQDPSQAPRWPSSPQTIHEREVRRFAQATGQTWSGPHQPVPPLFLQTWSYPDLEPAQLPPDGAPMGLPPDGLPAPWVGGASHFTWHRPLHLGQTLQVHREPPALAQRLGRSGPLHIVSIVTRFVDDHGQLVAQEQAQFLRKLGVEGAL